MGNKKKRPDKYIHVSNINKLHKQNGLKKNPFTEKNDAKREKEK